MPQLLRRIKVGFLVAGFCAALSLHVSAQVRPTAMDDAHQSGSAPPGVSVPDSPGAQERLDKARDKENQKQWKTAAEFYQEALAKYPGRVVLVRHDADRQSYQYEGIAPLVQERLARWPAEAIKIYRQVYGQTAADLLASASADDAAALRNVFWNYFLTDAGKSAGMQLLDRALEAGEFRVAAWMGDRLLSLYPDLGADRPGIVYRTAMAYHLSGDTAVAQKLVDSFKQTDATAVVNIGGKDVNVVESLGKLLSVPPPQPATRPSDAETYPSFGGLGSRGQLSHSSDNEQRAPLEHVTYTSPDFSAQMAQQFKVADEGSLASEAALGVMPVVDDGSLFFQDGRCVYAIDEDTGLPLPGWMNTYGPARSGRYKMPLPGRARNEMLTVTVTPSAVLAIMGQSDRGALLNGNPNAAFIMQQMGQTPASTVKLVCLDRDSGKELWTRQPADLPESMAVLHTSEYCGTPLVIPAAIAGRLGGANSIAEDCVLVTARGGKDNQFDDCYVVCLSLRTGQFRWSTYVGSATRVFDLEGFTAVQPSQMSLADGRVFVMTNLGTVAALDPTDGRMLWLSGYDRDMPENINAMPFRGGRMGRMQANTTASAKPWQHSPVLVEDGRVFVLPNDAKQLLVLNENTGIVEKNVPTNELCSAAAAGLNPLQDDASEGFVMLGIRDGIVCITSQRIVYTVDWKQYDREHGGRLLRWAADATPADRGRKDSDASLITGRGFVTADSIFIPTKYRLLRKSWRSGKTEQFYPATGAFAGDEGPGNLLVTDHNVVVAGQTRLDVYTNLERVRQRFETAMNAAPNDPRPRMDYAEALFAGGQPKEAIARVDEAIGLIGGPAAMASGKDRDLIFNQSLEFARRSGHADAGQITTANAFFDRAIQTADTPSQKATARLERAAFADDISDYAGEVKLCQEILSDDAMRAAALDNDISAAETAEARIAVAIHNHADAYAEIEQAAQQALLIARTNNSPELLLSVAAIYPNSKAAIDARSDAINRFEAANQPDKAIEVLRKVYTTKVDSVDRANVLVAIANDYLATPNGLGPAIDRLSRAARISQAVNLPRKLTLPDGKTLDGVTYQSAIESLRQMHYDQLSAALPDFHLGFPARKVTSPFTAGEPPIIANVTSLVHPLNDFVRYDQILTWSPAGLCIYPAGQTTPLATVAAVDKAPLGSAWVNNNWIVWTSGKVYQISGDGKLNWTYAIATQPALLVTTGRESAVNENGELTTQDIVQMQAAGQVIMVQNGQRIVMPNGVIMRRGRPMMPAQPVPAAPVVAARGDEEITGVQPAGPNGARLLLTSSNGRVAALDGRTGEVRWQTRPADHAVDQLLANAHFTIARMDDPGGSLLAVFDTSTGSAIGRRAYGPDGTPRQLVNVALSEDGMIAVTLFNQLMLKDLYDPWAGPKGSFTELSAQANRDAAPYAGLTQSDQILIQDGRLACAYAGGSFARAYDLSKNADPTNPLNTGAATPVVSLRLLGPRLFITSANTMCQYGLQDPTFYSHVGTGDSSGDYFAMAIDYHTFGFPPKVRGLFIGRQHAVVVADSVDRGPLGSSNMGLVGLRRTLIPGTNRVTGNLDWPIPVNDRTGITDWACADGSFYYLTRDARLHELRGAAQ